MKAAVAIFCFFLTGSLFAAGTNSLDPFVDPMKVLREDGVLTVSDGSSYYMFLTNGVFISGPEWMNGRVFEGKWTAKRFLPDSFESPCGCTFKITAKMSWATGIGRPPEYRRIVLTIGPGFKKGETRKFAKQSTSMFHCYFTIDELVEIPKPSE
jgi:hypothetical protein